MAITLDNNTWNFLFDNAIDLAHEFPCERFALFIPREVEIEAGAVPEERRLLREYIYRSIAEACVVTAGTVGFHTDESPIRAAPLNHGTFQSPLEAEVYAELRAYFRPKRKGSGLYVNEGDAAVAVASLFSVVLTMENPQTVGPLRHVRERGGKIVHLYGRSHAESFELRELVEACFLASG